MLLDSPTTPPSTTLAFPKTMLFSQTLTVTRSEQINHDTKRITFQLPAGENEVSGVPAGSAVLTQHTPSGAWFPVLRPYTPVSESDTRGEVQFIVKQYPNGRASTHMHSLAPGQTLQIRGPIPGYTYTPSDKPRDLIFVAGGAGITPIYSLAQGILKDAQDQTRIQLLWGVNGTRDIVLKEELEELEKRYPARLQVTYCVSGPESKPGSPSLGDEKKYKKGYVNKSALQEALARTTNLGDAKGTKVFLCGPPTMETALTAKGGVLAELGMEKKNIHRF
ncbi:NADH-cytochrome b5 reductase [Cercospora zeina]